MPRQRPHSGLDLLHLTLAMRQLSHDSRNFGVLGGVVVGSGWSGMARNSQEMPPLIEQPSRRVVEKGQTADILGNIDMQGLGPLYRSYSFLKRTH